MRSQDGTPPSAGRPVAAEAGNDPYPRYLAAKKGIDDRSLNQHVWETLRRELERQTGRERMTILEIGAGIGTMLERFIERGVLAGPITYLATDSDPRQLQAARRYLSPWAARCGHDLCWFADDRCRLRTADADVSVVLGLSRAEDLARRAAALGPLQLLIAHAVLDLVDFSVVLPPLLSRLGKHGLGYFTCNFDGQTRFLPEWEGEGEIIRRYHAAMELRLAGASRTGRNLLGFLQRPGLDLLAAGSSDWIVHPRHGGYAGDERFFLHAIIDTVEKAVAGKRRPPAQLAVWADGRHQQVEKGELSLLVSNLDLLIRCQDVSS